MLFRGLVLAEPAPTVDKTNPFYGEPNWGHAVCVPLIGLYFLYANRDELLRQPVAARVGGARHPGGRDPALRLGHLAGQNDFFKDVGMVIALFGVVLLAAGWHVMRIAWFPIAVPVCAASRGRTLFYSWVASPLQELAARVAVKVLNASPACDAREGTKIA